MRRPRRGSLLPVTMLVVSVLAVLGFAVMSAVVAEHREAVLAARGGAAVVAAESVLEAVRAELVGGRGGEEVRAALVPPVGEWRALSRPASPGGMARVEVGRPHPLVLWMAAEVAVPATAVAREAPLRRRVEQLWWLEPPQLPVSAAVSAATPVALEPGAVVDGRDHAVVSASCAWSGDTAPVAGLVLGALSASDTGRIRRQLALGGNGVGGLPAAPTGGGADGWGAAGVALPGGQLHGTHRWRGLLMVDGDLEVRGTLQVDGVLLVLGRLVVRGALRVRGAVTVLARDGGGSMLGADAQIVYSRCAVQLALATVAVPRSGLVGGWQAGAP